MYINMPALWFVSQTTTLLTCLPDRRERKIMRKSLSVSARLSKAFSSSSSADSLKRISSQVFITL